MFKQTSLCSVNTFLLLKHSKQLLKIYFFVFLCFVKQKSSKIFDVNIMWLVFISYKQQTYHVFKFLIWNVDWENQLVFITIHGNANAVFHLNFAKIFFLHRKLNPTIIKITHKFLSFCIILSGCTFTGLRCLTWHHKKHFWSLFLMLISPYFGLFNSAGNFMWELLDNGL